MRTNALEDGNMGITETTEDHHDNMTGDFTTDSIVHLAETITDITPHSIHHSKTKHI